jgi:hypothetical protein
MTVIETVLPPSNESFERARLKLIPYTPAWARKCACRQLS